MSALCCRFLAITLLSACGAGPVIPEKRLAPCPGTPNCVGSQEKGKPHISPLTYSGDRDDAMGRILALVSSLPRTTVITKTPDYLHVEFRSRWMGFVDDVEFWSPGEPPGIIHIRSASRLGYSDMGVNRKRMERIRELFDNP